MSGEQSLYERLGGEDALSAVVDEFYERMLADEQLQGYFEDADMNSLRAHQVQFFSSVTGGPVEYTGADMQEAHAHLELTHDDFEATAVHLQNTLESFDVGDENITSVMTAVASLEDDIVSD
ncbi:group I truncated hemoglobin [Haloferax sp. DFSO60]|uniref:group I truncated hemoglobin n=1 Tax=Haloferax sp. DFSO60 TaxID=3388652 RepID=UPI00397CC55E